MHLSSSVLSLARRLIPSVFGISRQGVRIEAGSYPDLSTDCMVQVGEDACFVASPATAATGHQVIGTTNKFHYGRGRGGRAFANYVSPGIKGGILISSSTGSVAVLEYESYSLNYHLLLGPIKMLLGDFEL